MLAEQTLGPEAVLYVGSWSQNVWRVRKTGRELGGQMQ